MQDKQIEQYLRKSTRGLWGKKKAEVREELSAHIQGRVHAHLVGGLSESDAVEKTLTELGHPTNVSTGMARLYTVPIVAGSGMALAMCCALVVVLLSGSAAQTLQTSDIFPVDECLEPKKVVLPDYCNIGGWTNIEDLKKVLEPQGVIFKPFKSVTDGWTLDFPEGTPMLLNTSSHEWFFESEEGKEFTLRPKQDFLPIREFIAGLSSLGLPVRLGGWEKPTLHIGEVVLELELFADEDNAVYNGQAFYSEALAWGVGSSLPSSTYTTWADSSRFTTEIKRFKVADAEGTVYGLVIKMDATKVPYLTEDVDNTSVIYYSDIGRVDADGYVTLRLPFKQPLQFLPTPVALYKEGHAVLVRLSGDMGLGSSYVAVPPDQIRLE